MRILMLSDHCCIRVVKQGLTLIDAGHQVYFMHRRVANIELIPVLAWQTFYQCDDDLRDKLTGAGNFDVIHVHNEPSALVTMARQCQPMAAIVYDAHDLDLARYDGATGEEAKALMDADAVIVPSQTYAAMLRTRYFCRLPVHCVYSWPLAEMAEMVQQQPHLGGIVYEGANNFHSRLAYMDYRDIARQLHAANIPFSMLAADAQCSGEYATLGVCVSGPYHYQPMLSELTRYDYGLCGPGHAPDLQWQRTVPNKLWEYVAAGIPVIAYGGGEVCEIVKEHGLGLVLESEKHLTTEVWARAMTEREHYRENVYVFRANMAMERQLPVIVQAYTDAMARRQTAVTFTPPAEPVLSIVVATCNRMGLLVTALDSFRRACHEVPWEIIVVDGGSTDRTLEWCASQPDVRVIAQGELLGACKAYSAGFAVARGKYVAAINDDCVAIGPCLAEAVAVLDDPSHGGRVAQVALRWCDPGEAGPYTRTVNEPLMLTGQGWRYANFGVTRKDAGDAVGWWGDYYHYAGDAELSMRLWDAGYSVAEVSDGGHIAHLRHNDETRRRENRDIGRFKDKWFAWRGPKCGPHKIKHPRGRPRKLPPFCAVQPPANTGATNG